MVKNAALDRDRHCVSAIGRPEFTEDVLQMHPDGSARITECSSDFFISKPLSYELEDLDFPIGECDLGQVLTKSLGDSGRYDPLARMDGANGLQDFRMQRLF